jgi:hypothetical protein
MPKFAVKSHDREAEEADRSAELQCGPSANIAQHTADEYRLEGDSDEKAGKPEPLLPLSDD